MSQRWHAWSALHKACNQDISAWDTSNVTTMAHTCFTLHQWSIRIILHRRPWTLPQWSLCLAVQHLSMVTLQRGIFQKPPLWKKCLCLHPPFNRDISTWNTSNVTTMAGISLGAKSFKQNISSWDTLNLTAMANVLCSAAVSFHQDIFFLRHWKGFIHGRDVWACYVLSARSVHTAYEKCTTKTWTIHVGTIFAVVKRLFAN